MVKETSPPEYAVESITRAKVVKKGRGKQGKQWLFWVKWKDYGMEHNTWEPTESFADGSEHFVEAFWRRVDLEGRDPADVSEFAVNEEILARGPPRGKPKGNKGKVKAAAEVVQPEPLQEMAELEIISQTGKSARRKSAVADANVESASSAPKSTRGRQSRIEIEEEPDSSTSKLARKRSVPESSSKVSPTSAKKPVVPSSGKTTGKRRVDSPSPVRESGKRRRLLRRNSSPDEILLVPDKPTHEEDPSSAGASSVEAVLAVPDSPTHESLFGDVDHERMAEVATSQAEEEPIDVDPPHGISVSGNSASLASEPASTKSSAPASSAPPAPRAEPYHRVRAANPRIKILDDPRIGTGFESAIPTKAKLMKRLSSGTPPVLVGPSSSSRSGPALPRPGRIPSSKAGPGRSSGGFNGSVLSPAASSSQAGSSGSGSREDLPTIVNDTQKASDEMNHSSKVEVHNSSQEPAEAEPLPPNPPTGDELLQLAGLKAADVGELADFEEDAQGEDDPDVVAAIAPVEPEALPKNLPVAANVASAVGRVGAAWMQSTIFGPLALGRELFATPAKETDENSELSRSAFLSLDPTVSLPVLFMDVQPRSSALDTRGKRAKGPPGKFYTDEFAPQVLDCLKLEGSVARVSLDTPVEDYQKEHFTRFFTRLKGGELFIEMVGNDLVAMCSAENRVLGEKLGMPSTLIGLADGVLVAHVAIADHSKYADVIDHADNGRW